MKTKETNFDKLNFEWIENKPLLFSKYNGR